MGEVTSFKGRVDWLLQESTIENINNGTYSAGDRETLHDQRQQSLHQQKQQLQEEQDIAKLKQAAEQDNEQGMIARIRLLIINNCSYAIYFSWFKKAEIAYDTKTNDLQIKGSTTFATEYINNNYFGKIREWVCEEPLANNPTCITSHQML